MSLQTMIVYWIHLPTETDPHSEGYVGITKRDLDKRFSEHKRDKSLSEEYVIEVLHTCETVEEAYALEEHYRPEPEIGMNKLPGGGEQVYPAIPKHKGWRDNISSSLKKPKTGAALIAAIENAKKGTEARRGTHDSLEVKRIKSEKAKRLYQNNPEIWARPQYKTPVMADGILYEGIKDVAEAYGVSRQTVGNRIGSDKWDWYRA
jgi:predicted GIY-YIG superfamily endonuclease